MNVEIGVYIVPCNLERIISLADSQDVVRLVLQFLKENNLKAAHQALQTESGISLNTVDNMETFVADVHSGRWDLVLAQVSSLQLPREKLVNLYEQVVIELLEAREIELAKELLRTTEPMRVMKIDQPDRYLKLEHLCQRPVFVASDAYEMGTSKQQKRQEIAQMLSTEISVVPPSRLLSLIGQALRFQQAQGLLPKDGTMDLFRGGRRSARKDQDEKLPTRQAGRITFSPDSHPETALFSPDGLSLVTGSVDGFIEVWDSDTCRLRKDLDYQARDELMMHEEEPVLCAAFNRDGELLATGSRDGKVKVWRVSTGVCLRKFSKAHSQGVTCVCFARDSTQIMTGSFDSLAKIHGLKSGKTLKEFRGHTSFVNSVLFAKDGSSALSGSSDGSVRLWDVRTTECLLTFRPGLSAMALSREMAVQAMHLMPNNPEHVLVCVKGPQAFIMTTQGQVLRCLSSGKQTGGDFTCATPSPQGKWVYCIGEDGVMYMFDALSGQLENVLTVADREVIGIAHHPHRNLISTITDNGELKLWKP